MSSLSRGHYKNRRQKVSYTISKRLNGCPQKKGISIKVRLVKPKKPNSAVRKIVKVRFNTKIMALVYIPGQGHNLHEYSRVLVRAGRTPDLPGLHYKVIRGKYDMQWAEDFDRSNRRSKFGVPKT